MKPLTIKTLFLTAAMILCGQVFAQDRITVTGTITDSDTGEPLIGVSILENGSISNGVTTDLDGKYSIAVDKDAVLDITYIGYETIKENVSGRAVINIGMHVQAEYMEEVVVVGYSTMKKRDVTGAISKVSSKDLNAIPVATGEQALQGRVAGMQVSAATGAPGADISVRIRGVGSIYSDNSPLYIIDGIPSSDGMNNISPNDIESITVLKDASSAAIYGSRATNGVIPITTRQGKSGDARITYNGTVNLQMAANLVDMTNTAEYVTLYNEAANNDNANSVLKRSLIPESILPELADVDYLSEIFRPALMHTHELSVSGGSDKIRYLVSGSYYDQDGIIMNSGYKRGTVRANVSAKAKDWLEIGLNINGTISDMKEVSSSGDGYSNSYGGSIVRYAMFRTPAIPIRYPDGRFVDRPGDYFGDPIYDTYFGNGYNPVGLAEYSDRNENKKTLFAKANVVIHLPWNFRLNTNAGIDYINSEKTVYHRTWGDDDRINNRNSLNVNNNENLNWTVNTALEYNREFSGGHNLSGLLGFEAIKETGKSLGASDYDFPVWDKSLIFIGNGSIEDISADQSSYAATLASFFIQANYNWKSRYFINLTAREDGTSRFVGKNRWGTFYAVSVGWTISNEPFMARQNVFSNLKLRAGYGAIGNQNVGIYAYSDHYGANKNYPFGGISYNGYAQTQLGNDNLKWETSKQFNAGVDMEFLKGKLGLSVDFYNKVTDDMLMQASYPPSIGNASTPWINSGKVLNRGVDIEIFYHHQFRNGNFDVSLNGGYLHNEVLEIASPISGGRVDNGIFATRTEVGYPIGSFFMYEMDGIFQSEYEVFSSAYQGEDIAPGDVKFKDNNNNGVIDADDRAHVGSAIPTFTMGLNLAFQWKNLDISAFFQGAFGQKIYNQILTDCEGFYRGFNVTQRYYDNRWTPENPSNTYPRASWNAKSNNDRISTRFLEDGSYMRLKNLQIGYTIPSRKFKEACTMRLYLSGTNLFTLTRYSGLDPEMTVSANSTSEGDRANGIDWGTYPVCRTFTFGVNLTF